MAQTVREIRAITDAMIAHEDTLLAQRNAEQSRSVRTLYGILGVTAVLLAFVGVGSIVIILRFVRDLTRSREELATLNEGLEDGVKERTADKILGGRFPERVLEKAVERMLPKESPLARKQLTHLRIYPGAEHPHAAQNPETIAFADLNAKNVRSA